MIIGEKPPSNIIKSCGRKGVNLTKKITVYKPVSELEQVCVIPVKKGKRSSSKSRVKSSSHKVHKKSSSHNTATPKKSTSKLLPRWFSSTPRLKRKLSRESSTEPTEPIKKRIKRRSKKKVIKRVKKKLLVIQDKLLSPKSVESKKSMKKPSFFKRVVSNPIRNFNSKLGRRLTPKRFSKKSSVVVREVKSPSIYSPSYSSNFKKPYDDFSNKVRSLSPREIMIPQGPIEFRRMVFLQKIPEHLGENVAALKQRMEDMDHIQRLLEAQLIKCRKSRTPERAVNNNQLVKIEKRIGEIRTEEEQYNKYVQLMQEFIGKYNQSKQEEQVKIDRLQSEIHDILKKVSSAFELQSQLFDAQEKILTNITNSEKASKTDLREWAKGIERVANEKDRLIEALVPATLRLQQIPEDTNAELRESIRELQRIYDKQGTMFGQIPYQPYPQYPQSTPQSYPQYPQSTPQSYPQSSELTQVLKNAERESLQKQFERLTDLILAKQQQAPAAIFQQQQQQQQQQAPQSLQLPAVINNAAGASKAELDELKAMIGNLTRMVLEKPERKMEPAKWDLPETSSANVRKMQEMQRNRDELLTTGRDKGDYDNQRDILASILLEEQKSQQKPQENQKLAMIEKLLGSSGGKGGDSSALLDFIIKMKLLKGLGFDVSDIFGGSPISNNTNTITNAVSGGSAEDKIMQKFDEVINILNTQKSPTTLYPDLTRHDAKNAADMQSSLPVAHVVSDRSVDLLGQILKAIRDGDFEGAHGHLNYFNKNIGAQTSNCDQLSSKLSEISENLVTLLDGGIPQISKEVGVMNTNITRLTSEIRGLISNINSIEQARAGQNAGMQTDSGKNELDTLKEQLSEKQKELSKLTNNVSEPLQQKLKGYEKQLNQIKDLVETIPNCNTLDLVGALEKFREQYLKAGTAEPLPSWCDDIKALVKNTLRMDLDLKVDRKKFTDYLEAIGNFLNDNVIDSLEKLKESISEIKKNKKCCENVKYLITIGRTLGSFEADMDNFEKNMYKFEADMEKGNPVNEQHVIDFNKLKKDFKTQQTSFFDIFSEKTKSLFKNDVEPEFKRVFKRSNDLFARYDELLLKAEKRIKEAAAEDEARRVAETAAAEAENLKAAEAAEAARRAEAAEEARRVAEKEAEANRKRLSADRRAAEARRAAEEEAAARKAKEDAKNCEQYLKEIKENYTPMDKKVFEDFKKRYNYIKNYKNNIKKFNELAKAIKEKILQNEIYDDDNFLENVNELNQNLNKLKCPNDMKTILKYKELIEQIEDVNDDFENVQGIGKVIVKSRPQIGGEEEYKKFLSPDGNKVQINDCDANINGEKGPYTAVFIGDNSTNTDIFNRSMGLGSIKGTVETMTKRAYNMLFLSYGLSGSGKTYTLLGDYKSVPGISQLSMGAIASGIKKEQYKVSCSSVQIYNDKIYDCSPNKNISVYKVTPDPNEQNKPGIKYLPGAEKSIITKLEELRDNWEKPEFTPGSRAFSEFKFGLINKVKEIFNNATLGDELIKDILIKIDKPVATNLEGNQLYIKNFIEENGTIESEKSKNKGNINYLINLVKLSKVSNFNFIDNNPGYIPINYSEGSIFDSVTQHSIKINKDSFNEYVTNHVIPNRFTRATLSNPDSSRSHLFIRIKFENDDPDKTFSMYIADLAGSEKPYEYIGEASIEGYFVLLTLKQIQKIMKNYSQHTPSSKQDINNLYSTEFSNFVQSNRKGATETEKNIVINNVKNKLKKKFAEIDFADIDTESGEAIYNTTKEILKWDNLQDADAKINKVITFINVKQFKPDDKEDHFTSTTICDAVNNTLTYGAELVGDIDKQNRFGRIARRRSYTRKSAKGTRIKRGRSFKLRKRPEITKSGSSLHSLVRTSGPQVPDGFRKVTRKRSYRRKQSLHGAPASPAVWASTEAAKRLRRRSIRRVRIDASRRSIRRSRM